MNKFIFPGALILLSAGVFFTYTQKEYALLQKNRETNMAYERAIQNSKLLIEKREQAVAAYNSISPEDQERLEKILPDSVDVVRLIVDVRTLLARRGISIKDIKAPQDGTLVGKMADTQQNPSAAIVADGEVAPDAPPEDPVRPVEVTIEFETTYPLFAEVVKDLETSMRIVEVSKVKITPTDDQNKSKFEMTIRTFWLKQK